MSSTKERSSSHSGRACWRGKMGYNLTVLNPHSHATTTLYSKTIQAVFQHGQGRNQWHLLGIFNTNLYLWNTGEGQKKSWKALDHPHFTAALVLVQLTKNFYPGQAGFGLCSFQDQNERATLLGKQDKVQSWCASRKRKINKVTLVMCYGSCLYQDEMNQRYSGYVLPFSSVRLVKTRIWLHQQRPQVN